MEHAAPTLPAPARERGAVLDPVERGSEILFGLIMAMTFTGAIRAAVGGGGEPAEDPAGEVRLLLFGALGCNLAWGVVDAVMYILTVQVQRNRRNRVLRELQRAGTTAEADRVLSDALPEDFARAMGPSELAAVRERLRALPEPPARARLDAGTLRGALGVFLLVALSTFPLVVPFLVLRDPVTAVRVSHTVALALLFGIGAALGRFSGQNPLRTGAVMVAVGVVLVVLTMALGG